MAHRLMAVLAVALLLALAWALWRHRLREPSLGRFAAVLAMLLAAQLATGLSNVVLGWPLLAALGHSAGAAGLTLLLALLLARTASQPTALAARAWAAAA